MALLAWPRSRDVEEQDEERRGRPKQKELYYKVEEEWGAKNAGGHCC